MTTFERTKQASIRPFFLLGALLLHAGTVMAQPPLPTGQNDKTEKQTQAAAPDWSKGALFGRVLDATNGQPLAGATVALHDKGGKVIAWTKTDAQGQYVIGTDPLSALQLRPSRRRGLLEKMVRGAGQVVSAPVKVAVGVARQVDPVGTVKSAALSAATANPAPALAQAANTAGKTITSLTSTKVRENTTKSLLGERQATPKEKRATLVPGEVFVSVAAPGFKALNDKAGAYWLEPPTAAAPDGKTPATGVRAWLETVKLAPASAPADKKSAVESVALLLAEGRADPPLAAAGATIKLFVKLATPGNQPLKVRLFARENKKRTLVELQPQEGAPGVFTGEMVLDAGLGAGDTIITLAALRAEPIEVRFKDKADPLLEFARGLDDLNAGEKYEFDPRIMASENRLDVTITILDPQKATPAAAGTGTNPAPSAAIPAPAPLPKTAPPPPPVVP